MCHKGTKEGGKRETRSRRQRSKSFLTQVRRDKKNTSKDGDTRDLRYGPTVNIPIDDYSYYSVITSDEVFSVGESVCKYVRALSTHTSYA